MNQRLTNYLDSKVVSGKASTCRVATCDVAHFQETGARNAEGVTQRSPGSAERRRRVAPPWVTENNAASTLKGLHNPACSCGTPSGFASSVRSIPQGGAASPLTLGSVVQPLRGSSTAGPNRATSNRFGFTLTELLVVIAIVVLLAVAALPAVLTGMDDRKFNDAARTIQAALMQARERAIASGQVQGLRLVRDTTDPWEVSTLFFVGVPEPYAVGTVTVSADIVTPTAALDPHFEQVDPGRDQTSGTPDDIPRVDAPRVSSPADIRTFQSYIRFNRAGRLYQIIQVIDTTPPATLKLAVAPMPPFPLGTQLQYQIFNPPSPVKDNPINLADGVVIDVRGSAMPYPANQSINVPRSRGIPNYVPPQVPYAGLDMTLGTADDLSAETWPPMDILFAPDGQVTGSGASSALIHFWVGQRADKGPDPTTSLGADGIPNNPPYTTSGDDVGPLRRHFLVTLNTRTGGIQIYHNLGTASLDLWPPPAGGPQRYPEIYQPAEQLLSTSQLNVP